METKKGTWIWNSCAEKKNAYVNFFRDFEVNDISEKAQIFICADSEYALWINGSFVSCGQYKDYPNHLCYDSLQIEKYLVKGKNTLLIEVYYQGEESFQYAQGEAGIWYLLQNGEMQITSDKNTLTFIAEGYTSGEIFKTTSQLAYGFEYDARKEKVENLKQADEIGEKKFYPRPVKKLVLTKKENVKIIAQGYLKREEEKDTPAQTMQIDYLSHRNFETLFDGKPTLPGKLTAKENNDLYFVIDFEEERCGFLSFDIEISEGACVDISYGQTLDDLRVRSDIEDRNFANKYISREGRQNFTYYFKRISGRYMQVHIMGFSYLNIYDMGIIRADYPVRNIGEFKSCDSLHNRIHDVCRETLVCCMHEHYEDTPWREQALYTSDSRNQMLFGYYTFSEYEMARSSLDLLARGMRKDAYISICAPTDVDLCIPSFSFIWFLQMKEYIQYSNDLSLAKELWNQMVYMLDTYTLNIRDGLAQRPRGKCYWHYYEWSEGNYFDDPFEEPASAEFERNYRDGLYNAFLVFAIESALWIGEKLSDKEFCIKYKEILIKLKEAINNCFWDNERGVYCSCTEYGKMKDYGELMQSIAVITGIASDERAEHLRKILSDKENSLVKITFAYTLYKYEALLMKNDTYMNSVLSDIEEQWGKMMYSDAVTVWELDKNSDDFGRAGSYCHGWSAVPIYIYYRYALGITPEFMRGETDATDNYKAFPLCRGKVETLKGEKEIVKKDSILFKEWA